MSESIIAVPDDQDKPGMLIIKVQPCDVERLGVEEFRILLDDRMRVLKGSRASSAEPARQPRPPRPRTGQTTPYRAKRAAMKDLPLRRLRRDGFTPYFGDEKRFLMTPPEFALVLACESRYVAMVIFEVLTQSVGYSAKSESGRREWVALSKRHFERRGLMSESQARRALGYAVEQGYLRRRRRGRQQWEYAVHYRQVDNVPR